MSSRLPGLALEEIVDKFLILVLSCRWHRSTLSKWPLLCSVIVVDAHVIPYWREGGRPKQQQRTHACIQFTSEFWKWSIWWRLWPQRLLTVARSVCPSICPRRLVRVARERLKCALSRCCCRRCRLCTAERTTKASFPWAVSATTETANCRRPTPRSAAG